MFGIENELFEQLLYMKERYDLIAIKAEFEAEGSSFNDVVRLRRLTEKAGVGLYLKIGGVEALRDIKDSIELGVDGLIAPMVESPFGLEKFLDAIQSVYKGRSARLAINIETQGAVERLDAILDLAAGSIDGVTIGRTDLSASYMDDSVVPDSEFIDGVVRTVGGAARRRGLSCTVGGSLSVVTVERYLASPELAALFDAMETRKVVLPAEVMLRAPGALEESLRLEELCILSKREINDSMIGADLARLEKLRSRVRPATAAGSH
jgi:hypothetical protein